jgi:hypothetical protein
VCASWKNATIGYAGEALLDLDDTVISYEVIKRSHDEEKKSSASMINAPTAAHVQHRSLIMVNLHGILLIAGSRQHLANGWIISSSTDCTKQILSRSANSNQQG